MMTDWQRLRIEWTWEEVAWILNHGGRERLEHVISYGRDVRNLAEEPTAPLVAWALDKWLAEHSMKARKERRSDDLRTLYHGAIILKDPAGDK